MPHHEPLGSPRSRAGSLPALLLFTIFYAFSAHSQDVLTYHNNTARTGLNNKETTLTLANVNSTTFGKLFTVPADGLVDAEPLYLSSVSISGVTHNLLIVATEHGSVYAYDADTGTHLWQITTLKSAKPLPTNAVALKSNPRSVSPPLPSSAAPRPATRSSTS